MIYDLIIIGAGAAGLFAGASLPYTVNGLILDKKELPGRKLLLSGSGQCNLTHGGSIKDFISHYGNNGPQIRSILYRFNNLSVIDFFEKQGVTLFEREDHKVFPKSLNSQDVLDVLLKSCQQNGLQFCGSSPIDRIVVNKGFFTVYCGKLQYRTTKLIVATGGASFPRTGSDGSFFSVLEEIDIKVSPLRPALAPVYVKQYPFRELSGISFQRTEIAIFNGDKEKTAERTDALLLTHTGFSGPAILNLSRYAHVSDSITINYYPVKPAQTMIKELSGILSGSTLSLLRVLNEYFNNSEDQVVMPKRFLELICSHVGIDPAIRSSVISTSILKSIIKLITSDTYQIRKLGGFESAMVTAGGVPLDEINLKTMESRKYPNLYFAGEILDVDGDTGGYNLQFAFSSGHLASKCAFSDKVISK